MALGLSKREYDEVEGVFHDGLGTFAEIKILLAIRDCLGLETQEDERENAQLELLQSEEKMERAITRCSEAGDGRAETLISEREAVRGCGQRALGCIDEQLRSDRWPGRSLDEVTSARHTATEFQGGQAADISLGFDDGGLVPVSVKTDKSGKVALAGIGQTGIEQAAHAFYGVGMGRLNELAATKLDRSLDEAKADFLDIAELWRWIMIESLRLRNPDECEPDINDFSECRPTSAEGVSHLMEAVRGAIHGQDGSMLVVVDRKTGGASYGSRLDLLPGEIGVDWIRFTTGRPQSGRRVGTSVGIKIARPGTPKGKSKTVFDHQVKHRRGRNRSIAFSDITTRVHR
jgi:hypothetical protein